MVKHFHKKVCDDNGGDGDPGTNRTCLKKSFNFSFFLGNLKTHMQRHAGTLPKRYNQNGQQRRQTTSRLLQVPAATAAAAAAALTLSSSSSSTTTTAAAAAAAAYAIAAAGNVTNIERK